MQDSKNNQQKQQSREEIDPYAGAVAALTYFGVPTDGVRFACPRCGSPISKNKTKIRRDGGITCFKCGSDASTGNMWGTVRLLAGYAGQQEPTVPQMLSILKGEDPNDRTRKFIDVSKVETVHEPDTVVDTEVLDALWAHANIDAGIAYWDRFYIDPRVVNAFDGRVITEPWGKVWKSLVAQFGVDRLLTAGLGKKLDDGSVWTVVGGRITDKSDRFAGDYNVMQPYKKADGTLVGVEVRGNAYIEKLVANHKAYRAAHDAWKAGGKVGEEPAKVRWLPKTRNLVGNATGSRVGFGIDVVARFPLTRVVWIVEGYKDVLAAGSMGRPAIGLAGAKAEVPQDVIEVLKGRRAAIAFDSDEAGEEGGALLASKLRDAGIELVPGPRWPEGRDVAEELAHMRQSQ